MRMVKGSTNKSEEINKLLIQLILRSVICRQITVQLPTLYCSIYLKLVFTKITFGRMAGYHQNIRPHRFHLPYRQWQLNHHTPNFRCVFLKLDPDVWKADQEQFWGMSYSRERLSEEWVIPGISFLGNIPFWVIGFWGMAFWDLSFWEMIYNRLQKYLPTCNVAPITMIMTTNRTVEYIWLSHDTSMMILCFETNNVTLKLFNNHVLTKYCFI